MRMATSWHFVMRLSAKGTLTGFARTQWPWKGRRKDHVRHNPVHDNNAVPRLGTGHECQRQAPARWPATLHPRWGAPGEDLAVRQEPAASAARTAGKHAGPMSKEIWMS